MDDRTVALKKYINELSKMRLDDLIYNGLKLERCQEIETEKRRLINSFDSETKNEILLYNELENELYTTLMQYIFDETLKDFTYIVNIFRVKY